MVKVGDRIKFNMESDDEELTNYLTENNLFGKELTVKEVDNEAKTFWIEGCNYAICGDDNYVECEEKYKSFGSCERFIILRDCVNEDMIYGILKVKLDKATRTYRTDDIQNRIYELKEEIGEEYTVEDIMEVILNEFDNIVEFNDCLEEDLEI